MPRCNLHTAQDSFVQRTFNAQSEDEKKTNFDVFFDAFLESHPGYSSDEAVTEMMRLYDDSAKMFASSLIGLRNFLSNYTQSALPNDATEEEIDAYFAEHEFEKKDAWLSAANAYTLFSLIYYGEESLLNYLVYTDDDYLSDTDYLENYDALSLPQRAKLYPFVAQMSAGQRCLLEYTAMDRMLIMGLMDEETWASTYASVQDDEVGVSEMEPCSVYAQVNRENYKVGSIAVTNAAQGKEASTGDPINEGIGGTGLSGLNVGLFVGGIVITIAGITIAVKNWGTGATADAPKAEKSIAGIPSIETDFMTQTLKTNHKVEMVLVKKNSIEELTEAIAQHNSRVNYVIKHPLWRNTPDGLTKNIEYNMGSASYKLTAPGPNKEIAYNAGVSVKYGEDGFVDTVTNCDGTVYHIRTNTTSVDQTIRDNYNEFMKQHNPQLVIQAEEAADQLDELAGAIGQEVPEALENAQKAWNSMKLAVTMNDGEIDYLDKFYKSIKKEAKTLDEMTADEFDDFAAYMEKNYPTGNQITEIRKVKQTNYKQILDANKAKNNAQQAADKVDDIVNGGEDAANDVANKADDAMTSATGSTFWKWFGIGMAIVGFVMSAYSVYAAIDEMSDYYHMEMIPIPRQMVDIGYLEDGSTTYIFYDCTKCNRNDVNMKNEVLEDYGDLNGDVMKQWLALYTTKDRNAGKPIRAGLTVKVGTDSVPMGKTPLTFFGMGYAVNMTDTKFVYNDTKKGIYLYYQPVSNAYTGTVVSTNQLFTTGVLSAFAGAGVTAAVIALVQRKKKKQGLAA